MKPCSLYAAMRSGIAAIVAKPIDRFDLLSAVETAAGRYRELGITELVLHWPIADSEFAADQKIFERIATEGLAHVDG